MAFQRSEPREKALSFKNQVLIAVGGRAFVHLPETIRGDFGPMVNTNDKPRASSTAHDLSDGQEVEILAWRPRSPLGLAYQIRRLSDGREWWIEALYLRKSLAIAAVS
jgi:hypothetical protein